MYFAKGIAVESFLRYFVSSAILHSKQIKKLLPKKIH